MGGGKFEIYPSSYSFKIAYERKYIFHSIPKLTCTNNRVNRIESFLSTDLSIRIDEQTEKRETRKEKEIYISVVLFRFGSIPAKETWFSTMKFVPNSAL